ncbi:MAG: hypothetical protein GYB67_07360 [Chloroflexi bacterium]|nr:hypothetical protein [Chloroflexota bacterium]
MRNAVRFWLILAVCLAGLRGSLRAQDLPPTATPVGFITNGTAEVLFPAAIRFTVTVGFEAEQVAAARLIISPDNRAAVDVGIDDVGAATVFSGPESTLAYLWPIPERAPPALFGPIGFTWVVLTTDGVQDQFEGRLQFTDQRSNWAQVSAADNSYQLTLPGTRGAAQSVQRALAPVYTLLTSATEQRSQQPIFNWLVYPADIAPGCATDPETGDPVVVQPRLGIVLPCRPQVATAIYAQNDYTVLQQPEFRSLIATIIGQMVQDFYAPLWGDQAPPAWFVEGLTQFYDPALKSGQFTLLQLAARNDRLLSLAAMTTAPPTDPELAALWRAQSYALLLYTADQVGFDAVLDLARQINDDTSFDAAYREIVGRAPTTLLPNLASWLFTDAAESAYTLTLYQPPTPTPRPPTATFTPSVTPTATPTLTPTVTGVLSPTPFPTLTPSRTWTPLPPSLTPRPPGSLFTPTPSPTPIVTPIDVIAEPGVQSTLIAVLVIVLAVLVVVYIRLSRQ